MAFLVNAPVASPATPAAPSARGSVVVVSSPQGLAEHLLAWDDLAEHALEPNAFYEPWMLLPALKAFGAGPDVFFVLVFLPDPAKPMLGSELAGFFPVQRFKRYKKLPISVLSLWRHLHCFLCTPLLRAGRAQEAWQAFLDWAATDSRGAAAVVLPHVAADGPFQQVLLEHAHQHRAVTFLEEGYLRALAVRSSGADRYLNQVLSASQRSEYRRLRRRLAELGQIETVVLGPEGDLESWVEAFLQLEAAGWKGKKQTALSCSAVERDFFRTCTREAFRRGKLMMASLELDGRPIAMKCNFLAPPGSFAFKIAFDEAYARYSPGVLLELDNLELLHQTPGLAWMDSCAVPDHPMINRLWRERRTVQSVVLSTRPWGDLVLSSLPLLRWLGRRLRRICP